MPRGSEDGDGMGGHYETFLRRFVAQDDKISALERKMAAVETNQAMLIQGVANFRDFQAEGRDFYSRSDERSIAEKEFHNKRDQEIKDALMAHNNRQTLMLALLMVIVAALGIILAIPPAIKALHDTGIHFPKIFTLTAPQQAYNSKLEAGNDHR
jgi:hypothetical protein